MNIVKTSTKQYEVTIIPGVWKIPFGKFVEVREKHGLKIKPFEHCFCCGHAFAADEIPVMASVSSKGNLFVCASCTEQEAHDAD